MADPQDTIDPNVVAAAQQFSEHLETSRKSLVDVQKLTQDISVDMQKIADAQTQVDDLLRSGKYKEVADAYVKQSVAMQKILDAYTMLSSAIQRTGKGNVLSYYTELLNKLNSIVLAHQRLANQMRTATAQAPTVSEQPQQGSVGAAAQVAQVMEKAAARMKSMTAGAAASAAEYAQTMQDVNDALSDGKVLTQGQADDFASAKGVAEKKLAVFTEEHAMLEQITKEMHEQTDVQRAQLTLTIANQQATEKRTAAAAKQAKEEREKNKQESDKEKQIGKIKRVGGALGFATSLYDILMAAMRAADDVRKIHAATLQVASAQEKVTTAVGHTEQRLSAADKIIWDMRTGFLMNAEEATEYVRSLAWAGMRLDTMNKLAKDLHSTEVLRGISVKDQWGFIKHMTVEYGKEEEAAFNLNRHLQDTSFLVRDMSMEEMVSDMQELRDSTKVLNQDLDTTNLQFVSLLNHSTMFGKGMATAPRSVQKEFFKEMTAAPMDLDLNWKAVLGRGNTPGEKIRDIYNIPENAQKGGPSAQMEMFTRIADYLEENTKGFEGDKDDKFVALLKLLEPLVKSEEAKLVLAKTFSSGEYNKKTFLDAAKTINEATKKQAEEAKAKGEAQDAERAKMVAAAEAVSRGMMSMVDIIKEVGSQNLAKSLKVFGSNIDWVLQGFIKLSNALGDFVAWLIEKGFAKEHHYGRAVRDVTLATDLDISDRSDVTNDFTRAEEMLQERIPATEYQRHRENLEGHYGGAIAAPIGTSVDSMQQETAVRDTWNKSTTNMGELLYAKMHGGLPPHKQSIAQLTSDERDTLYRQSVATRTGIAELELAVDTQLNSIVHSANAKSLLVKGNDLVNNNIIREYAAQDNMNSLALETITEINRKIVTEPYIYKMALAARGTDQWSIFIQRLVENVKSKKIYEELNRNPSFKQVFLKITE